MARVALDSLAIAAMAAVWGLRLSVHLRGARVIGHDFVFVQAQALLDVVFALPFLVYVPWCPRGDVAP